MTRFGYTLMTEQSGPRELVEHAVGAERAGLKCIGLRSGGYSEAELVEAGAVLVVDAPEDLMDVNWETYLSESAGAEGDA